MKKTFLIILLLLLFCLGFNAQKVKDFSNNKEMNYLFSRISKGIIQKELYNNGLFITVFELSDSKATPNECMEDFLSSYLISVTPDGDYYSFSKLYKIEGFYNPKILEIKEAKPSTNFTIKIEFGPVGERKVELFKFKGID